jgi:3-hydroxymyristoyl/3-hydroxydecanoyl-(acyl carrier protein) dehydratase
MHFSLIDRVLERSDKHVLAIKHVSAAEEYLQDHFPGFPVLPGVMMLESMVHAARLLAPNHPRLVLAKVGALKYGSFVQPGDTLLVRATLIRLSNQPELDVRVEAIKIAPGQPLSQPDAPRAASGRLTLRPIQTPASLHADPHSPPSHA